MTVPDEGQLEALADAGLLGLQRLAVVGGLTGKMVHFLNNPLTVLKTNVEFLRDRIAEGEATGVLAAEGAERVAELLGAVADVDFVIAALGEYDRAASKPAGPVDMTEVLLTAHGVVSMKVRYRAELELLVPDEPVMIYGRFGELQQLVACMLLHVGARPAEFGPVSGALTMDADGVSLVLEDHRPERADSDSPGPPRFNPDPGLAVSTHIATEHQGDLTYTVLVDGGVRYRLVLPPFDDAP